MKQHIKVQDLSNLLKSRGKNEIYRYLAPTGFRERQITLFWMKFHDLSAQSFPLVK